MSKREEKGTLRMCGLGIGTGREKQGTRAVGVDSLGEAMQPV